MSGQSALFFNCFVLFNSIGAILIYLPSSSPDFNPIEEAFSAIKAWLRCHEKDFTHEDQHPWLIHQAAAAISTSDAIGWFQDCGYIS
jgi:hypothetical protein